LCLSTPKIDNDAPEKSTLKENIATKCCTLVSNDSSFNRNYL